MAEPALSEITQIQGNPELAYGAAGNGGTNVVIAPSQGVQYLNNAANLKQENDWRQYQSYVDAMKENTKNLPDINGVRAADLKDIQPDYQKLLRIYAENPSVVANPMTNPDLWAEQKQLEAGIRGKIAESKYNLATEKLSAETLANNPALNSEENQSSLSKFRGMSSADIAKSGFQIPLKAPLTFDANAVHDFASKVAEQQLTQDYNNNSELKKLGFSNANDYILHTTSKVYNDKYLPAAKAYVKTFRMANNVGHTYNDVLFDTYKKQGGTGDISSKDYDQYLDNVLSAGKPSNSVSTEVKPNTPEMEGKQLAQQASEGDKNRANAMALANKRLAFDYAELAFKKDASGIAKEGELGGEYNENLASFVKSGKISRSVGQNVYGDNTEIEVKSGEHIANADDPSGHSFVLNESTKKMPSKVFLGSTLLPNGNMMVRVMDYTKPASESQFDIMGGLKTDGQIPSSEKPITTPEVAKGAIEYVEVTPSQARLDLTNLYGSKYSTKVAAEAKKERKKKGWGEDNPDTEKMYEDLFGQKQGTTPTGKKKLDF